MSLDAAAIQGFFATLLGHSAFESCFDCQSGRPVAGSITYGVGLCAACAGTHDTGSMPISEVKRFSAGDWTEEQLRAFRVGGANNAREFISKNGIPSGSLGPSPTIVDVLSFYTSPTLEAYKGHLAGAVAAESTVRPGALVLDLSDLSGLGQKSSKLQATMPEDDDFDFDGNFDVASVMAGSRAGATTPAAASQAPAKPATSSFAPRRPGGGLGAARVGTGLGATRLGATPMPAASASASAVSPSASGISFDELERQARLEEARAKEQAAQRLAESSALRSDFMSGSSATTAAPVAAAPTSFNNPPPRHTDLNAESENLAKASAMDRLGMGAGRLGFGAHAAAAPKKPATTFEPMSDNDRQKYSSAKSISSDTFFGRDNYGGNQYHGGDSGRYGANGYGY